MAKPFTWVVQFTVDPIWVANGFAISDARALDMLAGACSYATIGTELSAKVLHAPSALRIAREQGYSKDDYRSGPVVRELIAGAPNSGNLHRALIAARKLLDSVAFVAVAGDTAKPLALIDSALTDLSGPNEIEE